MDLCYCPHCGMSRPETSRIRWCNQCGRDMQSPALDIQEAQRLLAEIEFGAQGIRILQMQLLNQVSWDHTNETKHADTCWARFNQAHHQLWRLLGLPE